MTTMTILLIVSAACTAGCITAMLLLWRRQKRDYETMAGWAGNLAGTIAALRVDVTSAIGRLDELEKERPKSEEKERPQSEEEKRHEILLRQMNDEMEKSLELEKSWNEGVSSILNYSYQGVLEGMKHE